jgi:hypothetical protein
MRILYAAALLLASSFSVHAQNLPKVSHFDRDQFLRETQLFTYANGGDGFSTSQEAKQGFQEQKFPNGSEQLLGLHPTANRYGFVMGSAQLLCELAAWRLESSNKSFFRGTGHVIMYSGAIAHMAGIGNRMILVRSKP